MDLGLGGKIAIVTGGSKGIGRAVALSFVNEGASVLVCARGQQELDETVAAAGPGAAGRIAAAAADLTRGDQIEAVVERCQAIYGGVDILVNNAGSTRPGEFLKLSDEAWMEDWSLKFFGYVRMAREVIPLMEKRGGGVIINVIGTGALRPAAGFMIGGAVNAALNHFTKSLADDGRQARGARGRRESGADPDRAAAALHACREKKRKKRCADPLRWDAPASPRRSPTWWHFLPPIAPPLSTAPTSRSTAAPIPA